MTHPEYRHLLDVAQIGLGLYIHIPWCVKKCPYCDFNSHALPDNAPFEAYVEALIADAKAQAAFVGGRYISSIFIGGGTPSLLPVAQLERLFNALFKSLPIAENCEITLEANPATLERAPFEAYLALGINRLSIGVQSFDDKALLALDRVHDSTQASEAIYQARQAGFDRVNVDIMHGLPNQTAVQAYQDIERALQLGATHLSWYQLTIEPNTAFYRAPPDLPNEDTLAEIEAVGRALLMERGFENYEVSAWVGADDVPCQHNLNYWRFGDYLAIGAGAHGKLTLADKPSCELLKALGFDKKGVYRYAKTRLPKDYLAYQNYPKFVQTERISEEALVGEFMMNALRLRQGVSVREFEIATGILVSAIDNELIPLQHQGLMVADAGRIAPTALGFSYVNHLVQAFLK
ncbi:MAG: radical SAM family heme chaperone HemW [Moraxella sp.]|nr:radical SAM family heme chaperone HemW [Moraxella sp.]